MTEVRQTKHHNVGAANTHTHTHNLKLNTRGEIFRRRTEEVKWLLSWSRIGTNVENKTVAPTINNPQNADRLQQRSEVSSEGSFTVSAVPLASLASELLLLEEEAEDKLISSSSCMLIITIVAQWELVSCCLSWSCVDYMWGKSLGQCSVCSKRWASFRCCVSFFSAGRRHY